MNDENKQEVEQEIDSENIDISGLTNKIAELEEKNAELKDSYLRAYAEMDNIKKRSLVEIERKEKYAITGFAKDLLSIADSLERALASVPEDNKDELLNGFVSGMKITQSELNNVFDRYKITKITSVGEKFNPDKHQVIQTVEQADTEDGIIVSEWQSGYMLSDRVLRDSKVVVVKNSK